MYMNELIWAEKRDIATLVALGAINRAQSGRDKSGPYSRCDQIGYIRL